MQSLRATFATRGILIVIGALIAIAASAVTAVAVRAGAGDAQEVALFVWFVQRSGQSERDLLYFAMHQLFRGTGDIPGKAQFFCQHVCRSAREQSHRNAMAILSTGKSVDDFVERAVAPAGDDELASFGGGLLSHRRGIAGRPRFLQFGLNAAQRENAARLVQHAAPARAAVAGVRIMNQQSVAKWWQHRPSGRAR